MQRGPRPECFRGQPFVLPALYNRPVREALAIVSTRLASLHQDNIENRTSPCNLLIYSYSLPRSSGIYWQHDQRGQRSNAIKGVDQRGQSNLIESNYSDPFDPFDPSVPFDQAIDYH